MNDNEIKKKQAKKNFEKMISNLNPLNDSKMPQKEDIQLIFNLLNAKKNYLYNLHLKNPDKDFYDDSTPFEDYKKCSDSNTIFFFAYKCEYYFGKEQKLKLEVTTNDSNQIKSYNLDITIGEVIGSENSTKCFYINKNQSDEILEVIAKKIQKKEKFLTVHFNLKIMSNRGEPVTKKQEKQYFENESYKIYYQIVKNKYILYESEVFTDDGKFNIVQIPVRLLNSDFIVIFYNNKNKILTKIDTNLQAMTHSKEQMFYNRQLTINDKLYIYNYSSIKEEITFLDYINNGVRIALDIGIDFTGSNGHPDDIGTLHCRLPDQPKRNPYERAILSCAEIMANYDYDQLFPVYGFGAIIKNTDEVSMCFNINFKDDPNIQFVDNIMKEYYSCLDKIYFSGPTCFAPIINKIISEIKKEDDILEYHVLMILTDGIIDDFEETVDALVEGSFLPLSVIIVGIGDADFTKMNILDGDEIPLISSDGRKRQRDLVQFVPFNKFEGDEKKLTEEVLDEIPRQIVEYYTLNFLYPELLKDNKDNANDEPQFQPKKSNDLNPSTRRLSDAGVSLFNQKNSENRSINNSNNINVNNSNKKYININKSATNNSKNNNIYNNNNNNPFKNNNNNNNINDFINMKIPNPNAYEPQGKPNYIPNPYVKNNKNIMNNNNMNNNMNNMNNNYMNNMNNNYMNNSGNNNNNMNNNYMNNSGNNNNYSMNNNNMNNYGNNNNYPLDNNYSNRNNRKKFVNIPK